MATSKLNGPRATRFVDCPLGFLDALGAKVDLDGAEMRLGMARIKLLTPFVTEQRDEHNIRCRPCGNLTDDEKSDLEGFGFEFEPRPEWPGCYYSVKEFKIGSGYRQIFA